MNTKKVPKWFWPVGIAVALVIGLYLRNRAASAGSASGSSQSPASDVTGPAAAYTASGAYPDTNIPASAYLSSPYGAGSLSSAFGLPANFDPTSFENGIQFAQGQLGLPSSGDIPASSAGIPVSTPSPVTVSIFTAPVNGTLSGTPNTSGKPPSKTLPKGWLSAPRGHRPPDKKGYTVKGLGGGQWAYVPKPKSKGK